MLSAFLCVMGLWLMVPATSYAQTGEEIRNTAIVSFNQGSGRLTISTNEVVLVIEAARTASTIEFFRFAPTAPNPLVATINGSNFSPSGDLAGPFVGIGPAVTSNGAAIDVSTPVSLSPATRYLAGELIFVRITDPGQNSSPTTIESISAILTSSSGDTITLEFFESGPDTGEFFAYLPSSPDETALNDNVFSTPGNSQVTATYVDAFDSSDVSIDTAVIEPFSRVFDSLSGDLVDNAIVTIIDRATGQPATVFGVDGVSSFPSTVESGTIAVDSSGLQYPLGPGEFVFPVLPEGDYELQIVTPAGFIFSSLWVNSTFSGLSNAPFRIIPGSFGQSFAVDEFGPLNFDVPLDGAGDLVITKEATVQTAAVGDFVPYTVQIENRSQATSSLLLVDTLPEGFRYQEDTARISGISIANPDIGPDGQTLTFDAGLLGPGQTTTLSYVALVSAGAPLGEAVNEVVGVDARGSVISNRAEAAVIIREDLLRSRSTIIGRVAEDACSPDQEWARDIEDGVGVGGVRIYLETGDYVVTDDDGLFHFEDVLPGTHVVQVDTETLPQGYEPVICEENSRYAGSAISRFVDAVGGTIWRANFYLERTGEIALEEEEYVFQDGLEHLDYDDAWLEQQNDDVEWVYPDTTRTPSTLSVNIGIKHAAFDRVAMTLNGQPTPGLNFGGSDTSEDGVVAISRWRGLDIKRGRNIVKAVVTDQFGNKRAELSRDIWFVSEAERAVLVDDQSELIADGRTNPRIAVRLTDAFGRPVHAGRQVGIDLAPPYRLASTENFEGEQPVAAALSATASVEVGPNGVAYVELAPTLETGRARLNVALDNGPQEEIEVFLRPEKRDWILVGLAEGSLGLERLDGPSTIDANDLLNEGRLAFFAKGVIKGDWLLTLAVDTAKRRGDADGDLFGGQIDPNAFYTLYGDRTFQDKEAESRYPLYVKLEKNTFQILFGDYETDLNDTILGRYNRRFSGLKSVYEGKNLSFSGFVAESNQGFQRNEFAADGTSGPFILEAAPLIRNSERIILETRDRFRPDQIVETTNLARFVDYEIDFDTGEIIFRTPVAATDENFNPVVIVAEYETSAAVERNITAGGRVAARAFNNRVEVGATYIREEGDDQVTDAVSQLAGVDLTVQIDNKTELHAEYAVTRRDNAAQAATNNDQTADAILVEVIRRQEALTLSAYFREDEAGFGLGQQSSATTGGVRRFGASVLAEIGKKRREDGNSRAAHFVSAEAYKEESLQNGDNRNVIEAALRREGAFLNSSIGIRTVEENFQGLADGARRSTLVTTSVNKNFDKLGLNVSAAHEQPIAGDESTNFPQRTILGVDKTITKRATLNARHEILDGDNADGNNTIVGVTVQPFNGTTVTAAADLITQDSARRIGATVGVDQVIRINDKWTAGVGLARRANISSTGTGNPLDVVPDAAISPLETAPVSPLTGTESFTSFYSGLGYSGEKTAAATRYELRASALGTRHTGTFGAAREANDKLSYALASRIESNQQDNVNDTLRFDARLGLALRPRANNGVVIFNRLDSSYNEVSGQSESWKIVNNFGLNTYVGKRTQLALFHGVKYNQTTFLGDSFDSVTNLVGGQIRYDVTRRIDVGVSGSALISDSGQTDYQIGPSVGFSPVENTWITLGWNVEGFADDDFEAAEFTRDGPFIKLRVKFDQNTARGLLDRISPRGR